MGSRSFQPCSNAPLSRPIAAAPGSLAARSRCPPSRSGRPPLPQVHAANGGLVRGRQVASAPRRARQLSERAPPRTARRRRCDHVESATTACGPLKASAFSRQMAARAICPRSRTRRGSLVMAPRVGSRRARPGEQRARGGRRRAARPSSVLAIARRPHTIGGSAPAHRPSEQQVLRVDGGVDVPSSRAIVCPSAPMSDTRARRGRRVKPPAAHLRAALAESASSLRPAPVRLFGRWRRCRARARTRCLHPLGAIDSRVRLRSRQIDRAASRAPRASTAGVVDHPLHSRDEVVELELAARGKMNTARCARLALPPAPCRAGCRALSA